MTKFQVCPKCGESLELCKINFDKSRHNASGWNINCKLCLNAEYRRREKERSKAAGYRNFREDQGYTVLSCPGDEFPRLHKLPRGNVRASLQMGYMTPGMVLRQGDKIYMVDGKIGDKQRLVDADERLEVNL